MTLQDLETKIGELFSPNSQRHNEAMAALGGLKAALEGLGRHGLALSVVEGLEQKFEEWPKALSHPIHGHLTVADEGEAEAAKAAGYKSVGAAEPPPPAPEPPPDTPEGLRAEEAQFGGTEREDIPQSSNDYMTQSGNQLAAETAVNIMSEKEAEGHASD